MRTSKAAKDRTAAFLAKAERLLRWSERAHSELVDHGRRGDLDDFERGLFTLLALISSVHEAIAAAATVAGEDKWVRDLNEEREKDRLLRYLWKARDADIHDAIIKWTPDFQQLQIHVVDAAKTHRVSRRYRQHATEAEDVQRLFNFLFEISSQTELLSKLKKGIRPKPELLTEAGVELDFMLQGVSLRQFAAKVAGKLVTIHEPDRHLGMQVSIGANVATGTALVYYRARLAALQALLANSAA